MSKGRSITLYRYLLALTATIGKYIYTLSKSQVSEALHVAQFPLPVADPGGVRGVQMHPPLAASNVFLRT